MSKKTARKPKAKAQKQTPVAAQPEPATATPKAQWADDNMVYACQCLESACVGVLREEDLSDAIETACEAAIVCANVCASHFSYGDEASLAERIGACNEMAKCCEALLEAIKGSDFDEDENYLKTCAQSCLQRCQITAGTEEEEETGPAHPEPENETATAVAVADKPRRNPNWLKVIAAKDKDGPTHMVINGFIGESETDDSGTSSKEFRSALDKIPAGNKIHLHINSEGGSIADGLEMYNSLKDRRPDVTTYNDGIALSAASLVALAGSTVVSPKSSMWMIHGARIATYGDEGTHKESIKMLKAFTEMMADVYAEETGHDKEEILSMMDKGDTWFTGAEAVAYGLADMHEADTENEDTEAMYGEGDTENEDIEARTHRLVVAALDPKKFNLPEKILAQISTGLEASGAGNDACTQPTVVTQSNSMTPTNTTPVASATPAAQTDDIKAVVMKERKARITGEVKRRAEGKVANAQLPWWIDRALENEDETYAAIDALPTIAPASEPIAHDIAQVFSNEPAKKQGPRLDAVVEIKKLPTAKQRVAALRAQWTPLIQETITRDLRAARSGLPVATNTYSSSLIVDFLVDQAITVLQNRWASLAAFTRDFSVNRLQEYSTAQVKIVATGASLLRGTKSSPITSFAPSGATINAAAVPVTHYSVPFGVSQEELMQGLRLENLVNINLAVLADGLISDALGVTKTSTFSAGTLVATSGTFGWTSEIPTLWGYLKKSPIKNLLLDGSYYAKLINQPGFFQATMVGERAGDRSKTFGWDVLEENTNWTGAEKNVVGFACNPQAIAAVAGLPQMPPTIPGATLAESVVEIPGPDISIAAYTWLDLASRTLACSFDVMAGFAAGDVTAGALLKSA